MERDGSAIVTRREVVRNLVVSVGGSALLSACGGRVSLAPPSPGAAPRFYAQREFALLSRVSDLLLPRTGTPGALDVGVPRVLDALMTEWASDETKAEHREALVTLDGELSTQVGGDFLVASGDDAERALAEVDRAAFEGDGVEGYRSLKGLITQAYFATEGGALEEEGWVAVPGRWDPCVDR